MKPRLNTKWRAALLLGGVLGAAAWWRLAPPAAGAAGSPPGAFAAARAPAPLARAVAAPPAAAARRRLPERDPLLEPAGDPFQPVSFLPPPPPPPAAVAPPPPPRPAPPPFPYRYFGRMVGPDGKLQTLLTRGDAMLAIRPRDVLDTDYRVDAVTETEIVITYLPMDEKTVMATRGVD